MKGINIMVARDLDKITIVVLDHEQESLDEVIEQIGSPKCTRSTMKRVRETVNLIGVLIDAQPADTLEERAIKSIEAATSSCDLILVDLSFDDDSKDSAIQQGRELAMKLREYFAGAAVGVYSKLDLTPKERGFISSDRFALRLDEIRKMYNGKRALNGDDWCDLFQTVVQRATDDRSRLPVALAPESVPSIDWSKSPPTRSVGFRRAAPKLVLRTLSDLRLSSDHRINLTVLAGGFSGSFLVKAEIKPGNASFVIKIDEDPAQLLEEFQGHSKVKTSVAYNYYLPLSSPVFKLTEDWWAAFAMPYEVAAKPLLQELPATGIELRQIYENLWNLCLFDLYGETTVADVAISDIMPTDASRIVEDGWESLARYRKTFESLNTKYLEAVETLTLALNRNFDSESISVPRVQAVHGDLNCRNVLYDKQTKGFRILDFPKVGPNGLPYDFVKAESELMLVMLDWSSGRDCDFQRIPVWESLADYFLKTLVPPARSFDDPEIDRAFEAICSIRQIYQNRAGTNGEVETGYRLYLLARVLRYLTYSDLTIAKRHLAFLWASKLASDLFPPKSAD